MNEVDALAGGGCYRGTSRLEASEVDGATDRVAVGHSFDLLVVLGLGQQPQPIGSKFTTGRIEGAAIGSAQVSAEGVDGYNEGPSVCLELCEESSRKRVKDGL